MRKITAVKCEELFFKGKLEYLFSVSNKAVFVKTTYETGDNNKAKEFLYIEVN